MLDTASALYGFYSGFDLPAYTTDNVPDDVDLPYITYRYVDTDWESPLSHYCMVYMRTRSNEPLLAKAEEIKAAIGTGLSISCADGCLYLHYLSAQFMSDVPDGSDVRSIYIDLQLDVLHS